MLAAQPELYDLLVVTDATASMGAFLWSLNRSLKDIIRISDTTACFSRIGVLAYRDYDSDQSYVTQWSGWYSRDKDSADISQADLLYFVSDLDPRCGGDWPEATRTGLAHAYQVMRPDAKTIILLYTDAPPHAAHYGGLWMTEQKALAKPDTYAGAGPLFTDWTVAARTLARGEKQAQVFCIVETGTGPAQEWTSMFAYLSTLTGGACVAFQTGPPPDAISKLTVGLLLAWMGAGKPGAKLDDKEIAAHVHFVDVGGIEQLRSDKDQTAVRYLTISNARDDRSILEANMARSSLSLDTLAQAIPRRERPVMDFAKRYKTDPEYRGIVVEQLAEIIESDVSAITLNPVFGALWRTVCNDRLNPARDGLITRFGLHVDKIEDAEKKDRLKKWLEASYDWAAEILETIKSVPGDARYPCVFLDPTVRFSAAENGSDGAEDSMEFTRDELLEIGRSCDYRILRRLGRILTRLTYVNTREELPAHVKDVAEDELPRIPMALTRPENKRKFWKVLLHTVLAGTMLGPRPAALLAALSLRMGIKPLEEAAIAELIAWRDNWNTLDIPETWNTSCLNLLLEADRKHLQSTAGPAGGQTILKPEDRRLFETLVNYKLLEMNMDTTLTAEIGWTPDKSEAPLGPVVVCKTCHFPRSVTVMAEDGVCGLCATACECGSGEAHDAWVKDRVSGTDNSNTIATWTECAMTSCRAQYVVYHPGKLNVRPKCHYCRQKNAVSTSHPGYKHLTEPPCVTCTQCTNRIIWPEAYRPADFNAAAFKCSACTNNQATITAHETTARLLARESGTTWLLRNSNATIPTPFANRSLFHTISTATCADRTLFPSKVEVLPTLPTTGSLLPAQTSALGLTLHGKPLHNTLSLITSLRGWITARRVEQGTCTLCFTDKSKRLLRLACGGRKGCGQRVCSECVENWYGLNAPGRVINVAALSCPFCRRQPTAKVALPGKSESLRRLGGLRDAVEEQGEWVYAWFGGCGFARRFVERVCARGVPEPEAGWRCEQCALAGVGAGGTRFVVKECPACGVATEKVAGCDHISCTCGAHWCFNCGKAVDQEEIYQHMSQEHGGWYEGRMYEEGYDGPDYDTDWDE